jgi:hypothetical protein
MGPIREPLYSRKRQSLPPTVLDIDEEARIGYNDSRLDSPSSGDSEDLSPLSTQTYTRHLTRPSRIQHDNAISEPIGL